MGGGWDIFFNWGSKFMLPSSTRWHMLIYKIILSSQSIQEQQDMSQGPQFSDP